MLTINPYNRRGPVIDPAEFKGQGQLLAQVVGGLPQNYNIYSEPQTGKSSFLHLLAHAVAATPEQKGWLPLFIDLDFLPERSDFAFWRYLLDNLTGRCRALGLETEGMRRVYEEAAATRQLYDIQQTMLAYLRSLGRDVLILLDNFDVVADSFPEEEALATMGKLRAACQQEVSHNRVCVVLTTRDPLFVLCDRRELPRAGWSQLHSILDYVPLEPLDEQGALSLIDGPWGAGVEGSPFTGAEKEWALRLAGGHPALLKRTCYHLLKTREAGPVSFERLREDVEADPHVSVLLDLFWERIRKNEARTNLPLQAVLASLAGGEEGDNRAALKELLSKGLAVEVGGRPRLASLILADFVRSQTKRHAESPAAGGGSAVRESPPKTHLDEAKQVLHFHGREISLTTLEFKLFRHLLQNAGRPCSREELIKVLWDRVPPITGGKDALEHIITRLRRKIEADHKNPRMILSIRKQGYLFHSDDADAYADESGGAHTYAGEGGQRAYAR